MDIAVASIPQTNATSIPLFTIPINEKGEPIIFTVITDTEPLLEELKARWIPGDKSIEDPSTFARAHITLTASYQLLWPLQKIHYEDLNRILLRYDRYPVNILETLAFIRAYPEYSKILELGPYATGSFHKWAEGETPIALSIHPTESGPPWNKKQMRIYWPTILGGKGQIFPGITVLVRTTELASDLTIDGSSLKLIV